MNGYIAIEEAIAIPGLAERRLPIPCTRLILLVAGSTISMSPVLTS